ncbi:MAG: FxLD family lanthipeptide [Streptosporangiaceae bacterium]
MDDSQVRGLEAGPFEDLFNLDVRVEAVSLPKGRCNATDDGCSNSCPSVGCSATCKNC